MCQSDVSPDKPLAANLQTCFHDAGSIVENIELTRAMNMDSEIDWRLAGIIELQENIRNQLLTLFSNEYRSMPR